MTRIVLIVGSAPDAARAVEIEKRSLHAIVAINNAWRIRPDWTHLVHAGDFPEERKPQAGPGQSILSHDAYVPANNAYGGIVFAGATMAFTTAYWVLDNLKPDIMAFCGCDMVYDQREGTSHFYGRGGADPLRPDPTLQNLEAKSNRLLLLAAREGCLCANLSKLPASRLTFPRIPLESIGEDLEAVHDGASRLINEHADHQAIRRALDTESALGLVAPFGDYWNFLDEIDPAALSKIDDIWFSSIDIERLSDQGNTTR